MISFKNLDKKEKDRILKIFTKKVKDLIYAKLSTDR